MRRGVRTRASERAGWRGSSAASLEEYEPLRGGPSLPPLKATQAELWCGPGPAKKTKRGSEFRRVFVEWWFGVRQAVIHKREIWNTHFALRRTYANTGR